MITQKELENVQTEIGEQAKSIDWRLMGEAAVLTAYDYDVMVVDGHATHYNVYSDTAPTGAGIVVAIGKNGTLVKALTITAAANSLEGDDLELTYVRGDRVGFKVTQVGSGTAGGDDLYVTIY